jgi:hypothetical protein
MNKLFQTLKTKGQDAFYIFFWSADSICFRKQPARPVHLMILSIPSRSSIGASFVVKIPEGCRTCSVQCLPLHFVPLPPLCVSLSRLRFGWKEWADRNVRPTENCIKGKEGPEIVSCRSLCRF